MTVELYLIAHKVRGEATFDIASTLERDGEAWWILPSTGHRAFPYWNVALSELEAEASPGTLAEALANAPADWPDFYAYHNQPRASAAAKPKRGFNDELTLEDLGL